MTEILRYWRNLSAAEKEEIKIKKGVKAITYEQIKNIFNELN